MNETTIEEQAIARLKAESDTRRLPRPSMRTLDRAAYVCIAFAISFGMIALYHWSKGTGHEGDFLILAAPFTIALPVVFFLMSRIYRAADRIKAAMADDVRIVLDGLREGRVTSLSPETTGILDDLVGARPIIEAVNAASVRVTEDGSPAMSRAELGAAIGLSESAIARIEKGMTVSADSRERFAAAPTSRKADVVRSRVDALTDIACSPRGVRGRLMWLAGSVPYLRAVSLASLGMFAFYWIVAFVDPTRIDRTTAHPDADRAFMAFGILSMVFVAWLAFRSRDFVRDIEARRIERSRVVLAGIRVSPTFVVLSREGREMRSVAPGLRTKAHELMAITQPGDRIEIDTDGTGTLLDFRNLTLGLGATRTFDKVRDLSQVE